VRELLRPASAALLAYTSLNMQELFPYDTLTHTRSLFLSSKTPNSPRDSARSSAGSLSVFAARVFATRTLVFPQRNFPSIIYLAETLGPIPTVSSSLMRLCSRDGEGSSNVAVFRAQLQDRLDNAGYRRCMNEMPNYPAKIHLETVYARPKLWSRNIISPIPPARARFGLCGMPRKYRAVLRRTVIPLALPPPSLSLSLSLISRWIFNRS